MYAVVTGFTGLILLSEIFANNMVQSLDLARGGATPDRLAVQPSPRPKCFAPQGCV